MATLTKDSFAATHKYARITARKARYVIDLIRGVPVEKALLDLRFCLRRASPMISKVLRSAVANAEQASGLEPGSLYVSKAYVDEGSTMKRWRPRAMGRAYPRTKRTCHIRVEVSAMPDSMKPVRKAAKKKAASEAAPPQVTPERADDVTPKANEGGKQE
jgi:large subunit ribosomal protein L22